MSQNHQKSKYGLAKNSFKDLLNGFALFLLVGLASYYIATLSVIASLHLLFLIVSVVFGILATLCRRLFYLGF
ncbi:hypothetical protein [Helicobacter turcicus]|uniref:Uncharacterized protein n=1 Tax=Helicobacter turcicus TaxID=2867412 RepID=A0ABS7JKM3_9HELI|nr:hypothetical protein [Helicobacter turcicus]MBX7489943.1 hypothetical protein [Helicobacter turcicus]MBX7544802.1 hypothetical protein [Helicobacter turcicus]